MTYELAKKLSNAGFPFTRPLCANPCEGTCFPTLSELIGACGGKIFELTRFDGKWMCKGGDKLTMVIGDTAKEAVAHLWLMLNKNVA